MKKIIKLIKLIIPIIFVFIFAGCDEILPPGKFEHLHIYEYPENDYFTPVKCSVEGCNEISFRQSKRIYDDKIKFTFNQDMKKSMLDDYQKVCDVLNAIEKYSEEKHKYDANSMLYKEEREFEVLYEQFFTNDYQTILEQFQNAQLIMDINEDEQSFSDYIEISTFYNEFIEKQYRIYAQVYETKYREYFFSEIDGWDDESINKALNLSKQYLDNEITNLNNRNQELIVEFRQTEDILDPTILDLYEEYFDNNKQLAKKYGYDNFIDYSSKEVYEREYSLNDEKMMIEYAKKHLPLAYYELKNASDVASSYYLTKKDKEQYYDYATRSIINNYNARIAINNYTKKINNQTYDIDFNKELLDLFENGNYFLGKSDAAYTTYNNIINKPIIFFGENDDYYSSCFTVIHEFGHYMNEVINSNNDNACSSFDLLETHSQTNELLLLNYLIEDVVDSNTLKRIFEINKIGNDLLTTMMSFCVASFEHAIYTNTYNGYNSNTLMEDGVITKNEYQTLFDSIIYEFGLSSYVNNEYWLYVCMEQPCYYISYATSSIASYQIYNIAKNNSFQDAIDSYIKLFTYTKSFDTFKNCEEILKYANLYSYKDENAYKMIKELCKTL